MSIRWKASMTVIGLGLIATRTLGLASSDFQLLLADPSAFEGKRVTLTGVASVDGAEFFLYPNTQAAKEGNLSRSVFVARDLKGPPYDRFNNHWLSVTGIVTAKGHGPVGFQGPLIWLERVESLPYPPLPDRRIYAIFRNDCADTVTVKVSAPNGYSMFDVRPFSTAPPGVIATGTAEVTDASGKVMLRTPLPPPRSAGKYFDPLHRAYYYHITGNRIDLVRPSETTKWDVYWPTDVGSTPK